MLKQNKVALRVKERNFLKELVSKGKEKARTITRCRILLLADRGQSDSKIIEALGIARNTVRQVPAKICQRRTRSSHQRTAATRGTAKVYRGRQGKDYSSCLLKAARRP